MIPIKDKNPAELFPFVTILIIAANVGMFLVQLSHGPKNFEHFTLSLALTPKAFASHPLASKEYGSVFTSMFLHGGWLHLGGNMLFLWIFGNNIEDYFGHFKYAIFYLAAGVGAALTHIFVNPASAVPTIGASGAIAGVLGAYFVLFPKARIVTLVPIFFFLYFLEIPAFVFLGVFILLQFLFGLPSIGGTPAQAQGIAWFAHIGGFFSGILLMFILGKRRGFYRR